MSQISVIIPAYNQSQYLEHAIQSVLKQTYEELELIIVDDGSTDCTKEIIKSFTDPRIKYIYQDNRGLSAARNTGIINSSGSMLSFLDADDLFLPNKLALLIKGLSTNPNFGLIAGQAIPIDESGEQIGKIFNKPIPQDTSHLLLWNPLHVGSVLLRREWQEKVGLFDEDLRSYEDWDMWLRLAIAGCKMGWVAEPVSLYRFHMAQMTRDGAQMTTATFAVLDKIYSKPNLPSKWLQMKTTAFSYANLRAMAQAFHAEEYKRARDYLNEAVKLNPELITNDACLLTNQFAAWAESPKIADPIAYLELIYEHLSQHLPILESRRRKDIGRAAMQLAYEAFDKGDFKKARSFAWRAFSYQPEWLLNRGSVAIFIRSSLHRFIR